MGLFKKKGKYPGGLYKDKSGDFRFDLTEEEQRVVKDAFEMFKDYRVNPKYSNEIQAFITSYALFNLADSKRVFLNLEPKKKQESILNELVSYLVKAYSIYQLPIYLYDLACIYEAIGKIDEAKNLFIKFLDDQSNYKPSQIGEDLMKIPRRNIKESIKDSEKRLGR